MKTPQSVDEVLTQIDSNEKKARSFRVILTTLAIAGSLALVGLAVDKTVQYVSAHESLVLEKKKADEERERAEEQKLRAEEETKRANEEKEKADEARNVADYEKQRVMEEQKKTEDAMQKFLVEQQRADVLDEKVKQLELEKKCGEAIKASASKIPDFSPEKMDTFMKDAQNYLVNNKNRKLGNERGKKRPQ